MPNRLALLRRIAFAALLASGSAGAVPFPDDLAGPPSYSLIGCSYAETWDRDYVTTAIGLSRQQLERMERRFGYTPGRICTADPRLIEGLARNASQPGKRWDQPDYAWEQRRRQLQNGDGEIPPNALQEALSQRTTMLPPPTGKELLQKAAGISQGAWTWLGPGNIGGRVRAISPDPATPGRILIGSVAGGIWKTQNSGSTWTAIDDFMPNIAITCLVRVPGTPGTIYACTGEGFFNGDSVRGQGLFRSINNGEDWTQVSSTNPRTGNPVISDDWYYVNRLAISPTNPQVMLAATNGGLYRTTDGAVTWTKVYQQVGTINGTARFRRVLDVQFHPADGNIALLGEGRHCNYTTGSCVSDGAAVAYSSDGGATWARTKLDTTAISNQLGRVEIGWSKSNPSVVYAVVDHAQGKLYKSTDGGASWGAQNVPVSTPAHLGTQGWYGNAIWVAPNDANRLIVGGINQKMSINGGTSWVSLSTSVHVDHHVYASDPGYDTNFTLYNGNDGGVYKATNANTATPGTSQPTWSNLNNGLGITQFYGGAGKGAGGRITGGSQDNGTLLWTGTTNWVRIWGSDGGDSAADQGDGNYVYGMTQFGGIVRYTQALSASPPANASQYICTGITDASCNFNNNNPTILFIPPMAIDPVSSNTLFLGAQNLWRSTNIKDAVNTNVSWSIVRSSRPTNAYGFIPYVSAVAVAPGNSDVVWIGYDDGQLACTTTATQASPTWITVTQPAGTAPRYVTKIGYDPSNTNRVFVAYGGYQAANETPSNLHVETMGCVANPLWSNLHTFPPKVPVRAIAVHPGNSSWLYAGTEIGVFTSTNNGASWSASNEGPATASVEELFFMDGATLVAATHGRGMFMASALPGTPPVFTSSPPADGSVGVGYTHNYTASGSPAPTFSLQSGAFPTGLSLNGATGVLSGTPTTAGNFSGNVNATNTSGVVGQTFSITIAAQLPGAPTIGAATAGNAQASITFTPPASNGGSPITGYIASCAPGPVTANGAASPITVTGLTNGTLYTCSVRAINAAGTGPASGTVTVTPVSGVALALVSVKSRKNHGPSGTFDLLLDPTIPVGGAITVEPRAILTGHKIVFTFNDAITATGTATAVDETAAAVGSISAVAVGTTVEVTLTGVPPAKRVKVQLANVNGTLTTSAAIGFLLGDVNASYKVTSSDILMITGRSGNVTASNFLFDVDVSGAVSLSDINTAKAQSGTSLP
jgi:hypothetical protein